MIIVYILSNISTLLWIIFSTYKDTGVNSGAKLRTPEKCKNNSYKEGRIDKKKIDLIFKYMAYL